jgi:tRNA threonylcarbamoyladenosine biosynthesis protein TsaE
VNRVWRTASAAETRAVGESLGRELQPTEVVLLQGDLGAGKTVLVQGIAAALGVDPSEVQSPTFTLIREHRGEHGLLTHLDLYRLDDRAAAALPLEEILAGPGVKAVEWAERLGDAAPLGARRLRLRRLSETERSIEEE